MLCLSPFATLKLVDALGTDFDEKVIDWRSTLLMELKGTVEVCCI